MSDYVPPALGLLALALIVLGVRAGVKLRSIRQRGFGVSVYDFGADLKLPPPLNSRSYQIALYMTMKSLPREPAEPTPPRGASR
jgi:hypothetical protein